MDKRLGWLIITVYGVFVIASLYLFSRNAVIYALGEHYSGMVVGCQQKTVIKQVGNSAKSNTGKTQKDKLIGIASSFAPIVRIDNPTVLVTGRVFGEHSYCQDLRGQRITVIEFPAGKAGGVDVKSVHLLSFTQFWMLPTVMLGTSVFLGIFFMCPIFKRLKKNP